MSAAARPQTEKQFQAAVLEYAHLMGWLTYHTFDSRRSQEGFPDLVLVRERLVFAELKSEGGRMRPAQKHWYALLSRCSEMYVWRPSDWAEIERVLGKSEGRGT